MSSDFPHDEQSESEESDDEDDDEDDDDDDGRPQSSFKSTLSAIATKSGLCS